MSKQFSFCDSVGRILQYALCRDIDAEATAKASGLTKVEGYFDSNLFFLKGNAIVERPVMDITYSDNVLKNVPIGSKVRIDNEEYQADGTDIELSFLHNAEYHIQVFNFPYQDFSIRVTP
ncbi:MULTISPECIES: hypothetical protein [unclassified Serratia (in: enterobacteria)]|uniref:hypothetical protein n=1 Tax=unclassified Serratia (in: enterobacteria) TaxID=2647522 RepID=UPI0030766C5D